MPKDKRRVRDSGEYIPSRKLKGPGDVAKRSVVTHRVTRRMTTDAARDAVFYTAELLEQIFENLPPRSILTAQRVCHQFCDIVAQSSDLQNKMLGKDESAVVEEYIVERLPGNMGGDVFFHRLNKEALALIALNKDYRTYTLVTPNDMIFRPWRPTRANMVFGPWPTQMSEAEHVTAVLSHCGGDVFQLLPSLKSALLELRTDQKNSWQAMELCNPTRYGGIEVHVNVQIGSWILEFRHSIYKARPMTLGAVLREALENREDDDFTRHAWAYQYDGTPECLDYFTLNHWPYYEGTSVFALGSQSLQELITEKEQEYGVNAVMDVAPTIALSHCIQPSETVKKEVRERGSEAYVVAKLKEGRSKVAGMPVGHPGGNWFH